MYEKKNVCKIDFIFCNRICGNFGGVSFIKKNLGLINMMIV